VLGKILPENKDETGSKLRKRRDKAKIDDDKDMF
jgi:hypothetical protein